MTVEFAGGPYIFSGLDSEQETGIRNRFVGYCQERDTKESLGIQVSVMRFCQSEFREVAFAGCDYTFDRLYLETEVCLAGMDFLARIDRRDNLSTTLWTSSNTPADFMMIFENLFRVLVAYRLLELGGTILHSACVARLGRAFLMVGHSGAGKSTFSRMALAAGWEVLSDDMNAVRLDDGRWIIEKLPFAGDLGQTPTRSNRYPLAGIFRLNKSQTNRLSDWPKGQAVAKTLGCSPVVNDDPYRTQPLLDALDRMTASVPTRLLEFSLDGGALTLVSEALGSYD